MLAPQNATSEITDTLNGSLTQWYQNVDSALKASECVPGYYEYQPAPLYGTQCPIQDGGTTKIDIHTSRFNVISLENSYIDVEFDVPITIPSLVDTNRKWSNDNITLKNTYYIGFKSAFDLFDQYRIYSNGDIVYTQNQPYYESFLNYISLTDTAKENSECYATLDKIRARKTNVPGVYVEFNNGQGSALSFTAHLKFKIPITMFMILANLKWYPGFMGDLTIEIQTTYKNLVVACVDSAEIMNNIFENNPSLYPEGQVNTGGSAAQTDSTMISYDLT